MFPATRVCRVSSRASMVSTRAGSFRSAGMIRAVQVLIGVCPLRWCAMGLCVWGGAVPRRSGPGHRLVKGLCRAGEGAGHPVAAGHFGGGFWQVLGALGLSVLPVEERLLAYRGPEPGFCPEPVRADVARAIGGHAEEVADLVRGADPGDHDIGPLAQVPAVTAPAGDHGPAVFCYDIHPVVPVVHVVVDEHGYVVDGFAGVGGGHGPLSDCVHGVAPFLPKGLVGGAAGGARPAPALPRRCFGCWRSLRSCGRRRPVYPWGKDRGICGGYKRRRSAGADSTARRPRWSL